MFFSFGGDNMARGKKIKVVDVDLSNKPDVLVETVIEVKSPKAKVIKHDYRGTQYVKDLSR